MIFSFWWLPRAHNHHELRVPGPNGRHGPCSKTVPSSCGGQVPKLCGGELPCLERLFWAVAAHNQAIIGLCKVASVWAMLPPTHLAVSFTHMQIMEPLFVAIPGTYESQLMLPYGLQCHTARGGDGGAEHSDSGSQSSLPLRLTTVSGQLP